MSYLRASIVFATEVYDEDQAWSSLDCGLATDERTWCH